jgi:hypothetical protein
VIEETTEEKKTKTASQLLGVSSSVALEALGDFESNVVQTKEKEERNGTRHLTMSAPKSLASKKQVPWLCRSFRLCPLFGDLLSHSSAPLEHSLVELLPSICILTVYDVKYVER